MKLSGQINFCKLYVKSIVPKFVKTLSIKDAPSAKCENLQTNVLGTFATEPKQPPRAVAADDAGVGKSTIHEIKNKRNVTFN